MNKENSLKQILKSTGIVGGSQIFIIIIGIIRTKVIAVLLGPEGVGFTGLFQSVIDLVRSATGLGIGFSSVRDIAQANESNDEESISKTIIVLRRWNIIVGIIGAVITLIFCKSFSTLTFGSTLYSNEIALLSISVFVSSLSAGELAILQGLRKISSMVKVNLLGAIFGLIISIPLYYWLKLNGIVPALVIISIISLVLSLLFTRRIKITKVPVSLMQTYYTGLSFVKLGFFTVITSFASYGTLYFIKSYISRKINLEAVGMYQASYTISMMYLGMVLTAMGTDYYPRLSAINQDNVKLNSIVEDQIYVALLIGTPLVIIMLLLSSTIIYIFYSIKFESAIPVLRWFVLGTFFRLIAWPLGYVLLAKGKGSLYLISEIGMNMIYCAVVILGLYRVGLQITGIALVIQYLFYIPIIFIIYKFVVQRKLAASLKYLIIHYAFIVLITFLTALYFKGLYYYLIGGSLIAYTCSYSIFHLNKKINLVIAIKGLLGYKK